MRSFLRSVVRVIPRITAARVDAGYAAVFALAIIDKILLAQVIVAL